VRIQLGGKALKLTKRVAASGQRYASGDITLRVSKTGTTTLQRGKRTVECSR
jgi:membrane-bound inhibitor of C-type lysozyme